MIQNKDIIFYGPRLTSFFQIKTVGGGTMLFENIVPFLKLENIKHININGNSNFLIGKIFYNLYLICKYIFNINKYNVYFVAHRQAIIFLILDFIFYKKSIYRLIGGNFDFWFSNRFVQFLLKRNSKNCYMLCELPKDIDFFKKIKIKAHIQENFRSIQQKDYDIKTNQSKQFQSIGFLGRICNDKGLEEYINLAKSRTNDKFIIAGPFESKSDKDKLNNAVEILQNITYSGVLNKQQVEEFFKSIDVLFFHSNHKGEGKPGVLVESLINNNLIITNYHIDCNNWSPFYEKKNIILSDGSISNYNKLLNKNYQFRYSEKDISVFSSKYCFIQIKNLLNGFH